jgi:hypothetical protein
VVFSPGGKTMTQNLGMQKHQILVVPQVKNTSEDSEDDVLSRKESKGNQRFNNNMQKLNKR